MYFKRDIHSHERVGDLEVLLVAVVDGAAVAEVGGARAVDALLVDAAGVGRAAHVRVKPETEKDVILNLSMTSMTHLLHFPSSVSAKASTPKSWS